MKTYKWGIVGLGGIARDFATDFQQEHSQLTAVASRSLEKAQKFAAEFGIQQAYGSYQEMLSNPEIDVVYVAVPNKQHIAHILQALAAGKHVLCEKAITMNSSELQEAMTLAESKNLVLAEAMTIFNMPLFERLKGIIDSGRLGKIKMIQAPFGSYKDPDPTNRFFNPDLAGGALLDIGTYAVSFARYFLSAQPAVVASSMVPFETGVDEQSVTILRNKADEMASITLTFQAKMPKIGVIAGENGYITVADYPRADKAEIFFNDGGKEFIEAGSSQKAMNYEISNMVAFIEKTKPNRSLFLTRDVIDILDQMQQAWKKEI